MKHIKKFNENEEYQDYLDDSSGIHDSLLYDHGLPSDLEAYMEMKYNLTVGKDELPKEAQDLFNEIDSICNKVAPELRSKILRLYQVLTGDNSLENE